MHETSQGPAERDLLYQLQWVVYQTFRIMTKSIHVTPQVRRKGICYVTIQRWRFFHEIPRCPHRRCVGANRSWVKNGTRGSEPGSENWVSVTDNRVGEDGVHQSVPAPARCITFSAVGRRQQRLNCSLLDA